MKGTHIFTRGTSCAPSRNMCFPGKKMTSYNEGKYLIKCLCWGTHIFARGTSCAPRTNMCVPPKKGT